MHDGITKNVHFWSSESPQVLNGCIRIMHRKLRGVILIFFDFSEMSKIISSWSY